MHNNDVPFGFWVSDSSGHNSYHINGPNLTFKASFAGSISYHAVNDWIALNKDGKEIGAGSLHHARLLVEEYALKNYRK